MTEQQGLYGKYIIQKADGSPIDPDADYIVFRIDKPENLYERRAVWFYADCIAEENPQFHADLKNRVSTHDFRIAKEQEQSEARSIPSSVAVCPICGKGLWIDDISEVLQENETQILPIQMSLTCETEPSIDSEEWNEWHDGHFSQPYVDWLPVETKVLEWLRQPEQQQRVEVIWNG